MVPIHFFGRKWQCHKGVLDTLNVLQKGTVECTPERPHPECGYFYETTMIEDVFKALKSYADESPVKFWNKD